MHERAERRGVGGGGRDYVCKISTCNNSNNTRRAAAAAAAVARNGNIVKPSER